MSLRRAAACAFAFALFVLPGRAPARPDPPARKSKTPITGKAESRYARFDDLLVGFVDKYKLPGAALTVARDGKIVYSRGFGYADLDARQEMQPDALFRISSISKTITSAAVMKLVEDGKVTLDMGILSALDLRPPPGSFDKRWNQITLRNLLEHRGGWDHRKITDPMFNSPTIVREMGGTHPAMPAVTIRYMLSKQRLSFDPGTKFSYSNFGYTLLGRVIEKASGQTYEAYCKEHILKPLGLPRITQGKTLTRTPGEVRYHSTATAQAVMGPLLTRQVPTPYGGYCLEAMDSNSGWLASAPDLVRYAWAFADPKACKVLRPASVESLFARPEGEKEPAFYAKGWFVRPFPNGTMSVWHEGTIDGSSCMVVRRADGVSFAVMFNARQKAGKYEAIAAIELPIHLTANAIFGEKE